MPPPRLIEGREEREGEGAEIERDRELLGRLDPTLRPLLLRETRGAELCTREEPLEGARLRPMPPRDDVLREARESALAELFRERLIRAELAAVRDRAAASPPLLDGLTREAARGA
jgi:hypothetical protein